MASRCHAVDGIVFRLTEHPTVVSDPSCDPSLDSCFLHFSVIFRAPSHAFVHLSRLSLNVLESTRDPSHYAKPSSARANFASFYWRSACRLRVFRMCLAIHQMPECATGSGSKACMSSGPGQARNGFTSLSSSATNWGCTSGMSMPAR